MKPAKKIELGSTNLLALSVSPKGHTLFVFADKLLCMDFRQGKTLIEQPLCLNANLICAFFNNNMPTIVYTDDNADILRIYRDLNEVCVNMSDKIMDIVRHKNKIAARLSNGDLNIVDLNNLDVIEFKNLRLHEQSKISFSRCGRRVSVSNRHNVILLLDLKTKLEIARYTPRIQSYNICMIDSHRIFILSSNGTLECFDERLGDLSLSGIYMPFAPIYFTYYGKTLSAISKNEFFRFEPFAFEHVHQAKLDIKNEAVHTAINKYGDTFCVTDDTFAYFFDQQSYERQFSYYIEHKRFADALEFCDNNVFVEKNKTVLEEYFNKDAKAAIGQLELGKTNAASAILTYWTKAKPAQVKTIMDRFEDYFNFASLVRAKKWASAYAAIKKADFLQYTDSYESLQNIWNNVYEEAKELFMREDEVQAKELLIGFRDLPEKCDEIKQLILQKNVLNAFNKYANAKKYAVCFELAEEKPFLQNTPSYKKLLKQCAVAIAGIDSLLDNGDMRQTKELLDTFIGVKPYEEQINAYQKNLPIYSNFFMLANVQDYDKALLLASKYVFLRKTMAYHNILKNVGK